MAKKNTVQTMVYLNREASAPISRLEIAPSRGGGFYAAVYAKDRDSLAGLRQRLGDKAIISETSLNGQHVMVFHGESAESLLQTAQEATGNKLEKFEKKLKWHEKIDLMKVRGTVGNLGQVFVVGSAFGIRPAARGKKPVDKEKLISTGLSFIGNGINSYYGVQKKTDPIRLEFAKGKTNKFLRQQGLSADHLMDPEDSAVPDDEKEKPQGAIEKFHDWHKGHSIKTSNLLKLVGKYYYKLSGDRTGNKGNSLHGRLSLIAKVITLTGKDEDPYKLDKSADYVDKIRQKSNLFAGGLEWLANLSLWYGAFAKQGKEHQRDAKGFEKILGNQISPIEKNWREWDWMQLIGATLFMISLAAKTFSPFTQKRIDVAELTAHTATGLAKINDTRRNEVLSNVVANMMNTKELPEMHELGFAGTFAKLADDLEYRQGIAVRQGKPAIAPANTEQIALSQAAVEKSKAESKAKTENTPAQVGSSDKPRGVVESPERTEKENALLTTLTEAAMGGKKEAKRITDAINDPSKSTDFIHQLATQANERLMRDSKLAEAPREIVKSLSEKGGQYMDDIRNGLHKEALAELGTA